MDKRVARKGRLLIFIFALSVGLVWAPRTLFSASQAGTSLVVQVQPEAYVEADPPLGWATTGEQQTLSISLKAMIRLFDGTDGILSIYSLNDADSKASPLEIETETGFREITVSPVPVRTYSRSGTHRETVVIQRLSPVDPGSQPVVVVLRLTSSDGTSVWTETLTLPPDVSPAL